jgi:hypothetical protein
MDMIVLLKVKLSAVATQQSIQSSFGSVRAAGRLKLRLFLPYLG